MPLLFHVFVLPRSAKNCQALLLQFLLLNSEKNYSLFCTIQPPNIAPLCTTAPSYTLDGAVTTLKLLQYYLKTRCLQLLSYSISCPMAAKKGTEGAMTQGSVGSRRTYCIHLKGSDNSHSTGGYYVDNYGGKTTLTALLYPKASKGKRNLSQASGSS